MAAGQGIGLADQAHRIEAQAVDAHRIALLKADLNDLGLIRRRIHRHGHGVDLLGRLHVGILQGARFDRAAQQVEVDRIGRFLAHGRRNATALAVGDGLLAAHAPLPRRGEHLEVGGESADGHIEAHLVVALAGAAVGHRIGAHLTGNLNQSPRDQGPGQGCGEGIAAFIEGVSPNSREGEFGDEGLDQVAHDRLAGPRIERLLTNRLQLVALT